MIRKFLLLVVIFFSFQSIVAQENEDPLKHWWHKDLETDSIPGIGLERAYAEIIPGKEWNEVIVAVLDTKMDIDHEELRDQIWVNEDEIPGNGIDDDQNGFIDDVNGWNFLGNTQGGEVPYQLTEEIRVIRKYENENSSANNIPVDSTSLKLYLKAKESLAKLREESLEDIHLMDSLLRAFVETRDTLDVIFKGNTYSPAELDSLGNTMPEMAASFAWLGRMQAFDVDEQDFIDYREFSQNALDQMYNSDVDDRKNVNGGNSKVKDNSMPFQHATPVAAVIAASRNNDIGLAGISNKIRVMPIVMVAAGDEHDEDVAKAIHYAVDNGADIINMSWGKYYSSQTNLVRDAFEYAALNDVLLVSAAGNEGKNIDLETFYPTDYFNKEEQFENFMNIGALNHALDSTLVARFSNYGKTQVDMFAPGDRIYSAEPDNKYSYTRGTSFASPLVAGSAALLKGYYPKLSAAEIREILLASGDTVDLMVLRPGAEEEDPLIPFASLSKTGKILNVYRALLMAEALSSD